MPPCNSWSLALFLRVQDPELREFRLELLRSVRRELEVACEREGGVDHRSLAPQSVMDVVASRCPPTVPGNSPWHSRG